ncbi:MULTISPECIES: tail fiber assembly protein [unclassified Pseudomonas]|uniref:tail fiber assembly protein n=1 Tax=unclassified Pseudomonas TaxID=196821 RepID=UPI00091F4CA9|nr:MULTISPECIES: tail fiber assembly protein [unclassified Pseudomonas]SFY27043.1 virus tail fibre assembly protein, lambda gpK [Pseudomonas sp. NFACC47-1]SFY36558.1 virus tail fibre assembly protein, lambda gpK [Pseudomonas sp. NFACC43]
MFIYLFDETGVLSGPVELFVTPGLGIQIPSNGIQLSFELPPAQEHHSWVMVNGVPREMVDRRGPVYRKDNGAVLQWSEFGELPNPYTAEPWPGSYHVWRDTAWVFDQTLQLADLKREALVKRDKLLREAVQKIAPFQYAEDLGEANDQEQLALMEWKLYSVELNRIQNQSGYPTEINWPVMPASVV